MRFSAAAAAAAAAAALLLLLLAVTAADAAPDKSSLKVLNTCQFMCKCFCF